MFVINTAIPDPKAHIFIPTRIVVGCSDQAMSVFTALRDCGYYTEIVEVATPPERSADEALRAGQLMALLFAPAGGNA